MRLKRKGWCWVDEYGVRYGFDAENFRFINLTTGEAREIEREISDDEVIVEGGD